MAFPWAFHPPRQKRFSRDAATVTNHGKVFIVNEFGWDRTNWKSAADLQNLLDTIAHDPKISGDGFWALQAHLDNFGFQPIPADSHDAKYAVEGECGEWWALYYPGSLRLSCLHRIWVLVLSNCVTMLT